MIALDAAVVAVAFAVAAAAVAVTVGLKNGRATKQTGSVVCFALFSNQSDAKNINVILL